METMIRKLQRAFRPGLVFFASTLVMLAGITVARAELSSYTLFALIRQNETYLVDRDGVPVNNWTHENATATSVYMLPNGDLMRTAIAPATEFQTYGAGGLVERLDWDGNIVWEYTFVSEGAQLHHDIEPMPNGNVLMINWRRVTTEEAVAAGRDPDSLADNELWPESIIEVMPTGPAQGEIVWEWRVWDHLVQDFDESKANFGVVADHPELIDVNYIGIGNGAADWLHANALDYNAELDQVLISILTFCEVWVIDHSTTTVEAAGHSGGRSGKGGDLLFRWGNPAAYRAGGDADKRLYAQHGVKWIPPNYPGEGNILVFNNGRVRPQGNWSTIEEIVTSPREDGTYPMSGSGSYLPLESLLTYEAEVPETFFAANLSAAQRLRNGNTLITNGPAGEYFEVTPAGETVREFDTRSVTLTDGLLFRADDYVLSTIPPSGMVLDGGISGSWFDPGHDGEGWVIEVLEDGSVFLVWFTYPPDPSPGDEQRWIVGVGYIQNDHIVVEDLEILTGAVFGAGFDPADIVREDWGRLEMIFSDCSNGTVSYSGPPDYGEGSLVMKRLSRMDGLDCFSPVADASKFKAPDPADPADDEADFGLAAMAVSGSFFQPERDGEGWLMENLGDNRALAYWFTFSPDGTPAWLLGIGVINQSDVQFDDMLAFSGGRFGAAFNPDDVHFESWGRLNLFFDDCDNGTISYDALDDTWGEGEIPVIRLTSIAGTDCLSEIDSH
jgi:hypothetical protein